MSRCCDTDAASCTVATAESCLRCANKGVAVDRVTLKAILAGHALRRGIPPNPRFCANPACEVVYFDVESRSEFTEADLIEPVHAKHPDDPDVPVCYCFGVTPGSIAEEIRRTGRSGASADIAAEVKAGHCACEVRNPKGSCCLGDVVRVEKEAK